VPRNDAMSRAPSPGVQAKPRVTPPEAGPVETLDSEVSPGPRACVEGALTRVRAEKLREPRNLINGLLAPQGLVLLFAGYQMRPWRVCVAASHASNPTVSSLSVRVGSLARQAIQHENCSFSPLVFSSTIERNQTLVATTCIKLKICTLCAIKEDPNTHICFFIKGALLLKRFKPLHSASA
jgi:hypothetical protein